MNLIHEFFGMPNSGKSSAIKIVAEKLGGLGFNVRVIDEGTRNCPFDKGENQFLYTCWGLANTIKALTEKHSLKKGRIVVLVDRGPFDRLPFTRALVDLGYVTESQGDAFTKLSREFCGCIDSVSLHLCLPETAMKREREQGRVGEGRIMNLPFLKILYENYIDFISNQDMPNLIIVDSEEVSLEEVANLVFHHILSLLE